MFVGLGVAESPALLGFIATFLMGVLWIYLVGMAFALAGLALIAPSKRNIQRRQEQITAQGSPLSLEAALMTMPPGRPKG